MASVDKVTTELEARAIAQFDSLLQKGELFYEPTDEIRFEQQPFDVCQHRHDLPAFHLNVIFDEHISTDRSTSAFPQ